MKSPRIPLLLLIALAANALQAQVATLKSCLETGLTNNYSLRIVRNNEQVAANNATRAAAGMLPTVSATAGYAASLDSRTTRLRPDGSSSERHAGGTTLRASLDAEWTVFDGFRLQANYQRLQELRRQGATQTRIAIEDYMADVATQYYNLVQQHIRLANLNYAVALSRERLRIVQERYVIGSASRLDLLQARVDFNADSAQSLKQRELLATSCIRLSQLMARDGDHQHLLVRDTAIAVDATLNPDTLWAATLRCNASLLRAAQERRLAETDYRSVRSRDYPYVKLNAGYGYSLTTASTGTTRSRGEWGGDIGVTVGYRLFDGNRRREFRNAQIAIDNAALAEKDLELSLRADLADLWQAYRNNLSLLTLERENLVAARENYFIANERFLLGDLSGIEMREAQKSLLDAEERILVAEYNTKLCEISLHQISGTVTTYLEE